MYYSKCLMPIDRLYLGFGDWLIYITAYLFHNEKIQSASASHTIWHGVPASLFFHCGTYR